MFTGKQLYKSQMTLTMRFVMCMCRKTAVKISDDANYAFGHACAYAGKAAV